MKQKANHWKRGAALSVTSLFIITAMAGLANASFVDTIDDADFVHDDPIDETILGGQTRVTFTHDANDGYQEYPVGLTDSDIYVNELDLQAYAADQGLPNILASGDVADLSVRNYASFDEDPVPDYASFDAPGVYGRAADPFDPFVIPGDSITADPAIRDHLDDDHTDAECNPFQDPDGAGPIVFDEYPDEDECNSNMSWMHVVDQGGAGRDANQKKYLRMYYVPGTDLHGPDSTKANNPIAAPFEDVIFMETTYMMLQAPQGDVTGGTPLAMHAGSEMPFPANGYSLRDTGDQPGIDDDYRVSVTSTDGSGNLGYIKLQEDFTLVSDGQSTVSAGEWANFFDHTAFIGANGVLKVAYAGNPNRPMEGAVNAVVDGNERFYSRHNVVGTESHGVFDHRSWSISATQINTNPVTYQVSLSKAIRGGDTFYVDGVRYEWVAIHADDNGGITHMTVRTPLPKYCANTIPDFTWVTTQSIYCYGHGEPFPINPPFNHANFRGVDDNDWGLTSGINDPDSTPLGRSTDFSAINERVYIQPGHNYAAWLANAAPNNANRNYATGQTNLAFLWETAEPRFDTWRHELPRFDGGLGYPGEDGSLTGEWGKYGIWTQPDTYTEFLLPNLNGGWADGSSDTEETGDYTIATLWHNQDGDNRIVFTFDAVDGLNYPTGIYVNDFLPLMGVSTSIQDYITSEYSNAALGYANALLNAYGYDDEDGVPDYVNFDAPGVYDHAFDPFDAYSQFKDVIEFDPALRDHLDDDHTEPECNPFQGDNNGGLDYDFDQFPEVSGECDSNMSWMHVVDSGGAGRDANQKKYLRMYYVPGTDLHGPDSTKANNPIAAPIEDVVFLESTYMMLQAPQGDVTGGTPLAMHAGSEMPFPANGYSLRDTGDQPGIDDDYRVSVTSTDGSGNLGYIKLQEDFTLVSDGQSTVSAGEWANFFDHTAFIGANGVLKVAYAGNPNRPMEGAVNAVVDGNERFYSRHNVVGTESHGVFDHRSWSISATQINTNPVTYQVSLSKAIRGGDTFYVDGVRYEWVAIHADDNGGITHMTVRTPLPKYCEDEGGETTIPDFTWVTTQSIYCYGDGKPFPVNPPFNHANFRAVDDNDWGADDSEIFPLGVSWSDSDIDDRVYTQTGHNHAAWLFNAAPNSADRTYADGETNLFFVLEQEEPRFDTVLRELPAFTGDNLDGDWDRYGFYTEPDTYTMFHIPDNAGDCDGGCNGDTAEAGDVTLTSNWRLEATDGACPDSDADGVCDGDDVCPGGNDNADADNDGTPDDCDDTPCPPVFHPYDTNMDHMISPQELAQNRADFLSATPPATPQNLAQARAGFLAADEMYDLFPGTYFHGSSTYCLVA